MDGTERFHSFLGEINIKMVNKIKTLSFAMLALLAVFAVVMATPSIGNASATALAPGSTAAFNNSTNSAEDVPPPPPELIITVSPGIVTLNKTETVQFTAIENDSLGNVIPVTFTWTSSNTTVGTISSTGLFTALVNGTTTVIATNGSTSGNATVTVQASLAGVTTITVSPSAVTLNKTETVQFTAIGKDVGGNVIPITPTWTSSNTTVGTITSTGLFTALVSGTTTVIATNGTISGNATITIQAINIVDVYLPPGANPAQRKAGVTNAVNDYLFNHILSKADIIAIVNAYLFPS